VIAAPGPTGDAVAGAADARSSVGPGGGPAAPDQLN